MIAAGKFRVSRKYSMLLVTLGIVLFILFLWLTSCPMSRWFRIQEVRDCFYQAPTNQQNLARSGLVVEGMPSCLVYVAWGKPISTNSFKIPGNGTNIQCDVEVFRTTRCENYPQYIPFRTDFGNYYSITYRPANLAFLTGIHFKYALLLNTTLSEWGYMDSGPSRH